MPADRIVVGVGAVAVRDGRLLLVRRGKPPAKGLWAVPGGTLEVGERLADGALRELEEETGLTGRVLGPCGIVERIGDAHHIVIHDFLVELDDDREPVARDDAEAVAFADRAQLAELPLVPGMLDFLAAHGILDQLDG